MKTLKEKCESGEATDQEIVTFLQNNGLDRIFKENDSYKNQAEELGKENERLGKEAHESNRLLCKVSEQAEEIKTLKEENEKKIDQFTSHAALLNKENLRLESDLVKAKEQIQKLAQYARRLYHFADMPLEDFSGTEIAKSESFLKSAPVEQTKKTEEPISAFDILINSVKKVDNQPEEPYRFEYQTEYGIEGKEMSCDGQPKESKDNLELIAKAVDLSYDKGDHPLI